MWTLQMLQAHKGDFLVLENGDRRIIVDTGTSECKAELGKRLSTPGCELLIITHLDDDHYGGLHALASDALNGHISDGTIHWPKKIWLNHFEASNTIGEFAAGMRYDGSQLDLLDELKQAVDARGERGLSVRFALPEGEREMSAPIVVEGEDFVQYLSSSEERDAFDVEGWREDFHIFWHQVAHRIPWRLREEAERWLGPRGKERLAAELRRMLRELGESNEPADFRLARSNPTVSGVKITDRDLYDQIENGAIPQGLSPRIRGLLHQIRNGASIIERTKQTLTFVEALRKLGMTIETVRSGTKRAADGLTIEVIGPDATDLAVLQREWDSIRQKAAVHVNNLSLAFAEATMFAGIAGRFGLDRSVTNRSSIQCLAIGSSGYALLTGDGRPDTLERADLAGRVPERLPCRVFKAAHHGSPYNIRMKSPNAILKALAPEKLWVSGEKTHPALDFLKLLDAEAAGPRKFSIAVTNTNDSVELFKERLSIDVMKENLPFTCELG